MKNKLIRRDKRVSIEEAAKQVRNNDVLTLSGFGPALHPLAFVRQLIRQGTSNLTLVSMGECWGAEFLAASGLLKKANFSNFMFEGLGRCKAFSRTIEDGEIEIEDYSHFSISSRFMAGAMGLPFLPTRVMDGSDLVNIATTENKFKFMDCPFSGDQLVLVPEIRPDVAVIHGSRADREGNVQIFGPVALIDEQARAAKTVIATVEEVVSTECIRRNPEFTVLPSMIVDAVVEVPFGSHPSGMYKQYSYDSNHMMQYYDLSKTNEGVQNYLDEWVYGVDGHWQYLEKVGLRRLFELRADPYLGYSLLSRRAQL